MKALPVAEPAIDTAFKPSAIEGLTGATNDTFLATWTSKAQDPIFRPHGPGPSRELDIQVPQYRSPPPMTPNGWAARWGDLSQRYDFVSISTGESQWELPRAVVQPETSALSNQNQDRHRQAKSKNVYVGLATTQLPNTGLNNSPSALPRHMDNTPKYWKVIDLLMENQYIGV
jgi:hypothetical protein